MIKVPRGVAKSMALSHMLVGLVELLGVAVVGWSVKVALEEGTEKKNIENVFSLLDELSYRGSFSTESIRNHSALCVGTS